MKGNILELTADFIHILSTICKEDDLFAMRLFFKQELKLDFDELKELINNLKEQ